MLKFAFTVAAAFGMAGAGYAQSPAGDQGSPGTSINRNQQGTNRLGTGTQGTATNNQSGRTGAERADVGGQTGQGSTGVGTAGGTAGQGHMAGAGRLESHAADCLVLKNEEEIQLLQFALPKIQDNDLKQAAQKMIQDHQQAITKLQRFAAHSGDQRQASTGATATGTAGTTGTTTGASGTAVTSRDAGRPQSREALRVGTDERAGGATGTAGATGHQGMHDGDAHSAMYQIAQREKEECIRLTEQDLGKKEGAKFDKALAGQQCVMHTGMIAHLRALQGHGSSEFGQLVQQLEQTTEQHKQTLEGMMDKLAQNAESGKSDSNRSESSRSRK